MCIYWRGSSWRNHVIDRVRYRVRNKTDQQYSDIWAHLLCVIVLQTGRIMKCAHGRIRVSVSPPQYSIYICQNVRKRHNLFLYCKKKKKRQTSGLRKSRLAMDIILLFPSGRLPFMLLVCTRFVERHLCFFNEGTSIINRSNWYCHFLVPYFLICA